MLIAYVPTCHQMRTRWSIFYCSSVVAATVGVVGVVDRLESINYDPLTCVVAVGSPVKRQSDGLGHLAAWAKCQQGFADLIGLVCRVALD
jgi:hypothetical protein